MDEIIEAAARAVHGALSRSNVIAYLDMPDDTADVVARAAIAAIMPAIGERMIAEVFSPAGTDRTLYGPRIRALASTMAAEVGK